MPPKRRATSTRPQRTKKRPGRFETEAQPPKRQRKDPEPDPSDDSSAPDSETETPAPSRDSDLQAILAKLENLQSDVNTLKSNSDPENESTFLDHTVENNDHQIENLLLDSDSDSDDDIHNKNLAPFGSMVGSTVPHKIRSKILAGKFVEFSDLLPQNNLRQQQEEEYVMKSFGKNKAATYTRNQNK